MCCLSAKYVYAAIRRKNKDWLARNVSELGDMFICRLLFQWASTIKIQVCWSITKLISSSLHCYLICSRHDLADKLLSCRSTTITHSLTHSLTHSFHINWTPPRQKSFWSHPWWHIGLNFAVKSWKLEKRNFWMECVSVSNSSYVY
jgi:hypothetical protein